MTDCPICGAQIVNMRVHTAWHESLDRKLNTISEAARRYVEPPSYK